MESRTRPQLHMRVIANLHDCACDLDLLAPLVAPGQFQLGSIHFNFRFCQAKIKLSIIPINMMGGYCYYTYAEDLVSEIHDCMWSGECYTCQATRSSIPVVSTVPSNPINVEKAVGFTTLTTSTSALLQPETYIRSYARSTARVKESKPTKNAIRNHNNTHGSTMTATHYSTTRDNVKRVSNNYQNHHLQEHTSSSTCSFTSLSSENKKLRHREVEKNRHRQLQAMVRTLSDNIPGKLDKETQVQTMKRAARYCIYLREVLNLLSSNQTASGSLRKSFEMLYLRSCENVDLIMSSSAK